MTRIVLDSAQPMSVWWGPELIVIYNEPYREFMGEAKHPALGERARDMWSEIWDHVEPLVESVLRGEGVAEEDSRLHIRRDGALEEIFVTFSYSPIPDAGGSPVGLYNTAWETTQKVVAERRLQVLRKLT